MYNDYLSRKLLILASLATLNWQTLPQAISYQISFVLKQCMPTTSVFLGLYIVCIPGGSGFQGSTVQTRIVATMMVYGYLITNSRSLATRD